MDSLMTGEVRTIELTLNVGPLPYADHHYFTGPISL